MNEPRPLLELYKLLWEQIKDREFDYFYRETLELREKGIISRLEEDCLDYHAEMSIGNDFLSSDDRKAFVQRMIKELENDK